MVGALHDSAPAGLITATAIARLSAREDGSRLDDGRDGGGDAGRHVEDVLKTADMVSYRGSQMVMDARKRTR
jgi:hypothetical protein